MPTRRSARPFCVSLAVLAATLASAMGVRGEDKPAAKPAPRIDGRELFVREWIPGDKRSHGGDGLGPLFNDSSCVACHNQGGIGGGGPASKNAQILTAFPNPNIHSPQQAPHFTPAKTIPEEIFRGLFGNLDAPRRAAQQAVPAPARPTAQKIVGTVDFVNPTPAPAMTAEMRAKIEKERANLGKFHPGLATSPSVVLHRGATYAEYEAWRQRVVSGVLHSLTSGTTFFDPSSVNTLSAQAVDSIDVPVSVAAETTTEILTPDPIGVATDLEATTNSPQPFAITALQQQHKQEAQMAANRRLFNQSQQIGNFAITRSERNTTALFGAGLIDALTDEELIALEKKQATDKRVSGRAAVLKDGRTGRFGWKAQTAHLDDFVLTACAVELGLNVPDHQQAGLPHKPDYKPAGLDLNSAECRALVDFVAALPAPKQRPLADETDTEFVGAGQKLFAKIGCADCHVPDVGKAEGIYSDLLLHDMGPDLGDSGSSYGIFVPDSSPEGELAPSDDLVKNADGSPAAKPRPIGATRQEWRTPPLWGVRDSAPYLHDGRAETLDQAIAFHGGESQRSTSAYFSLSPQERFQVTTFLKSLVAPDMQPLAAR